MKSKVKSEIRGATAALRRASRSAWKLAKQTNTPFHVWKDGKVVNLNARSRNGRAK
jgi:hypothetical protein